MTSNKITVCLTSCGRFDLLKKTIDSFLSLNQFPDMIEKFIITEDSGKEDMRQKISDTYGDKIEIIFNEVNKGLFKSLDHMYNQVNTNYIFHCEDDWAFQGNSYFLNQSFEILENRPDVHQVWIRPINTLPGWVENGSFKTPDGLEYRMMASPHLGDWCGFSFNPGLRRLSDYKRMFPNGYSEFILSDKSIVYSEHNCNKIAAQQGYRAAILINGACDHIGQGQSTYT